MSELVTILHRLKPTRECAGDVRREILGVVNGVLVPQVDAIDPVGGGQVIVITHGLHAVGGACLFHPQSEVVHVFAVAAVCVSQSQRKM